MTATQPTQRVTRSSAAAATSVEQPKSVSAPKEGDVTAHLENELTTQLAFYASYHSNPVNKAIHFVFIPQILWSALIFLGYLNLPGFTYVDVGPGLTFRPSVGMLLAFAFQFYYIFLDEFVGGTYIPVMAALYLTSGYLANHNPAWLPLATAFTDKPSALPFALFVHFNGWFWQFLGHFKFEGRAPALFDNLTQALVTAPFFVHIEMLFGLFGWNPSLEKRIMNLSAKRIVAMNKAKRARGKKAE
ncbi:endoplasmic reticulum protein [Trichosporon asahii var. asahii CBS 8904]|uniref:Endoplasmic reticulum protein n=1 Tax=Trichosporon asahii var. asahii (strain CBS 8904) TaxID=1220162 RepID=K1W0J3_TRIAC|nr:endoplasmic reticulum protein [Trichosporon asahii var. asahii CBS 8904]